MSVTIVPSKKNPMFFRMPEAYGHYFGRLPVGRLWGQLSLILFLTKLSVRWSAIEPTRPFGLGDLAMENGGPMPDHVSHHTGVAADIFPIRSDGLQRSMLVNKTTWADPTYDRGRTLKLVRLIAQLSTVFPMIQFLY